MWTCVTCGEQHGELPLCFAAAPPWYQMDIPEAELAERMEANDDLCIVDGRSFFVRAHMELPVRGLDTPFVWVVWCSLSEQSFHHMTDRWDAPERDGDGYFGWLCSHLPVYDLPTIRLQANVRSRSPGFVPLVELHECDHPLYFEQRDGIGLDRVAEIVHELMHGPH